MPTCAISSDILSPGQWAHGTSIDREAQDQAEEGQSGALAQIAIAISITFDSTSRYQADVDSDV